MADTRQALDRKAPVSLQSRRIRLPPKWGEKTGSPRHNNGRADGHQLQTSVVMTLVSCPDRRPPQGNGLLDSNPLLTHDNSRIWRLSRHPQNSLISDHCLAEVSHSETVRVVSGTCIAWHLMYQCLQYVGDDCNSIVANLHASRKEISMNSLI